MSRSVVLALLVLAAGPAAALPPFPSLPGYRGCAETIPEGTFGCSNAANLRRQVAQPMDLRQGRTPTPTMGVLDATAMERLRTGRVQPLIGTTISETFGANSEGGTGGGSN